MWQKPFLSEIEKTAISTMAIRRALKTRLNIIDEISQRGALSSKGSTTLKSKTDEQIKNIISKGKNKIKAKEDKALASGNTKALLEAASIRASKDKEFYSRAGRIVERSSRRGGSPGNLSRNVWINTAGSTSGPNLKIITPTSAGKGNVVPISSSPLFSKPTRRA